MFTLIVGIICSMLALLLGYALGQRARNTASTAALEATQAAAKAASDAELARLNAALTTALAEKSAAQTQYAAAKTLAEERTRSLESVQAERDRLAATLTTTLAEKSATETTQAAEISRLRQALESERSKTGENLQLLQNAQQALAAQFQALAGKVLDERAKTYSESSRKELADLLQPLREQLTGFRSKVEESQLHSAESVAGLRELIASLSTMNQQLASEASALSEALRGSAKAQGDWGEFILLDLLEKAGLRQGHQFTFQQSFAESHSHDKSRTDVILRLPGNRHLVVDSKVSLVAWTDYSSATEEAARAAALKAHLASVRAHVKGLAAKKYHDLPGLASPDFVVLFIPIEPAALLALQSDPDLWQDAYRSNILIAGPTTLLFVIRIVDNLWQQEQQAKNVRDIADQGAKLYEKFVGFVENMQKLGQRLSQARDSYDEAFGKLSTGRDNLVRQVEKLQQLGVKPSRTLSPQIVAHALESDSANPAPLLDFAASEDPAGE